MCDYIYTAFLESQNLVSVLLQEAADELVGIHSGVVQIDTVTSGRSKVVVLGHRGRVESVDSSLSEVHGVTAVSEAERQISSTVDNGNRTGEVHGRRGDGGLSEKLTESDGALGGLTGSEDQRVEVGGAEETVLVADGGVVDEVTVVESSESVRLILRRDLQVQCGDESGDGGLIHREAGKDGSVESGGVHRSNRLSDGTAERVADTDDGAEVGASELAVTERHGELVCDADLKRSLDDLDGVGGGGQTNTETVVAESSITLLDSVVDVAVARGKVPVVTVKANTVGEELNRARNSAVGWHTEGSTNTEVARDVVHASHNALCEC